MQDEFISNCVAHIRRSKKITQKQLADAVGVSRQTIIAIEKGRYTPSVLLAIKIGEFFQKSVEDIFKVDRTGCN